MRMYARPMTADTEPLLRLAHYIESRIAELAMEYAEVCRLAGISDETLGKIRKGQKARGSTYRKLEGALQWESRSIAAILGGGEPTPISAGGVQSAAPSTPPALEQELELGRRLLAATVRELGLSMDEADEAWRRAREEIVRSHRIEARSDTPSDAPQRRHTG